jgi:hypothetical protein
VKYSVVDCHVKGQKTELTGKGPLRRRRSALDCSATEEEEDCHVSGNTEDVYKIFGCDLISVTTNRSCNCDSVLKGSENFILGWGLRAFWISSSVSYWKRTQYSGCDLLPWMGGRASPPKESYLCTSLVTETSSFCRLQTNTFIIILSTEDGNRSSCRNSVFFFWIQGKGTAVPVHAMKTYRGIDLWFHSFSMLNEVSGQVHAPAALLPLPIKETGSAPKPVWTFGDEIKFLPWPGVESRIVQPVAFLVYWLRCPVFLFNLRLGTMS